MNCFYHHTIVAVGVCKSCGKGLCPECAADLGKGIACKGHCENEVQSVIRLIDFNAAMVDAKKGNLRGGAMTNAGFYLAGGTLFALIAAGVFFSSDASERAGALFPPIFGVILLVMGFLGLRRALILPKGIKTPAPSP
jgi:hypothetical protein